MKTSAAFLIAGLALACGGGSLAAEAGADRVQVVYVHPENFTDVKDQAEPTPQGRQEILDALRSYIVAEAGRRLPAGARMVITFTDIDLAGDFEPWRGPEYDHLRIVKPIYPPAFKFSYVITDSSGRVLRKADENIRDLNFEMRDVLDRDDPLRYEKDVLREWIVKTLRRIP